MQKQFQTFNKQAGPVGGDKVSKTISITILYPYMSLQGPRGFSQEYCNRGQSNQRLFGGGGDKFKRIHL